MTGRHVKDRAPDMPPDPLRGGVKHGTKAAVEIIGRRWETRPISANETGKLEWVYQPEARHGAHDATPTIAEIAATEPCENTLRWPQASCATRGDLRVTSDEWSTGYCLPCRIRAALDREQNRPLWR